MLGEDGEGGPSSFYQNAMDQLSDAGRQGRGRTVSSTTGFLLPNDMSAGAVAGMLVLLRECSAVSRSSATMMDEPDAPPDASSRRGCRWNDSVASGDRAPRPASCMFHVRDRRATLTLAHLSVIGTMADDKQAYLAARYMSGPKADAILARTDPTTHKKKKRKLDKAPLRQVMGGIGVVDEDAFAGFSNNDGPEEEEVDAPGTQVHLLVSCIEN